MNVTPLIDVVMCLIIFFMLVAKIGVTSGAESEIDIPITQLGKDMNEIGVVWEVPLTTHRDIMDSRVQADLILRF